MLFTYDFLIVDPATGTDINLVNRVNMDSGEIVNHEVEEGVLKSDI